MKLKATANIDNIRFDCVGSMEIHWGDRWQAYVTWRFFNGDKLIASKSENFFYQEKNESDLVSRVLKKIKGYRIGRRKVFQNIEVVYE